MEPQWDGETKVCLRGLGHMTKMAAMPICSKNPFQNQKANDLVAWYVALGSWAHHSLFKRWPFVDLDLFYGKVKFGLLCFYMGKTVRKSFNGRILQQMTIVTKGLCSYKNSDPKGLSGSAPGLYTCIKTWKIMYKIRLQRHFFETWNKRAKWQSFSIDIWILSTKGCLPLPLGYIHVEKTLKNVY